VEPPQFFNALERPRAFHGRECIGLDDEAPVNIENLPRDPVRFLGCKE
jgi:hypothetical protein